MNQDRIIEVWNKVDLLEKALELDAFKKSDFPVVPLSALYGTNLKKLENLITERLNTITNK